LGDIRTSRSSWYNGKTAGFDGISKRGVGPRNAFPAPAPGSRGRGISRMIPPCV
jgi:hypothetical protein